MTPINKYTKYIAYLSFIILILMLIPLCVIGFFNHPLGDDYHYGQNAAIALRESGNILSVFPAALKGMIEEYNNWQGTYSAMFLMYIPPHVFGDFLYKLYPTVLLLSFCASIFFLLMPIIINNNVVSLASSESNVYNTSVYSWISISSLLCILSIEQIPVFGEAFFWYNGSMYYMGFLTLTFFFFGIIFRYIFNPHSVLLILAVLLGFWIAGGNYASLLPALLTLTCLIIYTLQNKPKKVSWGLISVLVVMITGLVISILAPGNAMRASTTTGTTPVKAIAKSIIQCTRYVVFFNGPISFICFALLSPILFNTAKKSSFKFKYSPINCIIALAIYCSSATAVFYGQNNGGPARLFDICIVMMYVFEMYALLSLFGFISKNIAERNKHHVYGFFIKAIVISTSIIFFILIVPNILSKSFVIPSSFTAAKCLINGDAKYYNSQYLERRELIKSNQGKDVVFQPYDVPASLNHYMYLGDLSDDPNNFNNEAFSKFYNLNSVYVDFD